jgi:GNAT superfamily N-acetyltransferase
MPSPPDSVLGPEGIAFSVHSRDELDLIEPLWEGLAAHHRERAQANAPGFLDEMNGMTFAARRDALLEKNRDRALRTELAFDPTAGAPVGYCVASGAPGGHGEVESIFVDETYRNRGIGGALLEHALAWMEGIGTVEQALSVFAGNPRTLRFYARHGFSPRFMVLVRRPPG